MHHKLGLEIGKSIAAREYPEDRDYRVFIYMEFVY